MTKFKFTLEIEMELPSFEKATDYKDMIFKNIQKLAKVKYIVDSELFFEALGDIDAEETEIKSEPTKFGLELRETLQECLDDGIFDEL